MIPVVVTFWALSAPMGFLCGRLYSAARGRSEDEDVLPWLAAVFPPLGAVLALVVLLSDYDPPSGDTHGRPDE